jgi:plastocyanin
VQAIMQKPFYTRIALLGVACVLLFAAIVLVSILILSPSDIGFPIVIGVVALVIGALINFIPHPWNLVVAVLAGLFCLMISSDGIDLSLTSPESFFDFSFPIFLITAGILLLIGGITGVIQYFRHRPSNGNPGLVTGIRALFAILALLLVVSAGLTVANLGSASAADKDGATYLSAKDEEFSTDALSASADGKIVVDNKDPLLHTFTIDDLDIDVKVGPGSHEVINLENVKPGEYFYRCRVSGHESMDGTLTVK